MASKQPFKVTSSKPQKTTGGNATKKAAQRKAGGTSSASYVGVAGNKPLFSTGIGNAAQGQAVGKSPTLSLPGGTPTVVPVAPPTIDPFATPTDEANQAIEEGQYDTYISGLLQQQGTNAADTTLKTGDIDRSLSQGLESNDWNSAARGIANSSIKDQNRAQMTTAAAAARNAETDKAKTFNDYVSGEKNRVDTVIKPAIGKKYNELHINNAQKAVDGWNQAHPDSAMGPNGQANPYYHAAAGGGGEAAAPTNLGTAGTPAYTGPSISAGGQQAQGGGTSGAVGKVKDGKFYHVYNEGKPNEKWVYVRPASS